MNDEVSRAIQSYEAEQHQLITSDEARQVRALIQGLLVGSMLQQKNAGAVRVQDVDLLQDENGDYEQHFVVVMQSGIRVRVDVTLDM